MGVKDMTISLALILMFSLALVTFGINFATDNGTTISLGSQSNFSEYQTTSKAAGDSFKVQVDDNLETFSKTKIQAGTENLERGELFQPNSLESTFESTKGIFGLVNQHIFGSDDNNGFRAISTILISLIGILIFYYSYKFWLGKNPD